MSAQLVIEGVRIPRQVIESGHVTAYACIKHGDVAVDEDRAYCSSCGATCEFYHEECWRCASTKPWLYRYELPPGRARLAAVDVQFDDLE